MRIVAFIEEPETITKILSCINEPTLPPRPSPARDPPEDYLDQSILEDNNLLNEINEFEGDKIQNHWNWVD